MRYRFVTNRPSYYVKSGTYLSDDLLCGDVQCHVEDENGKVVDEYSSGFHQHNHFFFKIPGEPNISHIEIYVDTREEVAWSRCFLLASDKWQPLDCNCLYSQTHVKSSFKNKSLRECAELIIRKHEQEREKSKTAAVEAKKAQIAQEKSREAEKKERQQKEKQEKIAKLKREEEARLKYEQRKRDIAIIKRLIGIFFIGIFFLVPVLIYSNDIYSSTVIYYINNIGKYPIEVSSFVTGCRFAYIFVISSVLGVSKDTPHPYDKDQTLQLSIGFGLVMSLLVGTVVSPLQYLILTFIFVTFENFFEMCFMGNLNFTIAGGVLGFIIGSIQQRIRYGKIDNI